MTTQRIAVAATACVLLGLFLIPLFSRIPETRYSPDANRCMSNVKQLGTAMAIYTGETDGVLPPSSWVVPLKPIANTQPNWSIPDDGIWSCPDILAQHKHGGYAMNSELMGTRIDDYEEIARTIMFFETDALGIDVIANLAARSGRHSGGSNYAALDTHAAYRKLGEAPGEKLVNRKD
ncbi:MAG: hypothetical protein ABL949_14825 [Fimbriimonadaceae bacterium]